MGRQQRPRPAAGGPAVAEGKSNGDTGPGHWAGRRRRQADSMGGWPGEEAAAPDATGSAARMRGSGGSDDAIQRTGAEEKKERKKLSRAASA